MRCAPCSFPRTAGCYASPTAATPIPRSPLPAPNLTFAPTLLPSPFLSSGIPGARGGSGPSDTVPHVNPIASATQQQGTCGTGTGAGGHSTCRLDPQPWCCGEVPSLPHSQLPGTATQVALGHGQGTAMAWAAPEGVEYPELSPTAAQSCSPTAAPCCPPTRQAEPRCLQHLHRSKAVTVLLRKKRGRRNMGKGREDVSHDFKMCSTG